MAQIARRSFVQSIIAILGGFNASTTASIAEQNFVFKGDEVFNKILSKATEGSWRKLALGELMGKIAKELEGAPYVASTLELSADREIPSVDLSCFDCVTFFESTVAFARMLKRGGSMPADLLNEVKFTRYRGGVPGDYSTRLHYTTDWFADNQEKQVVKILADLPGSEKFTQKVGFMSSHPNFYRQLAAHPELVAKIKDREDAINSRSMTFVPLNKIAGVEPLLKTGDIVGVCTSVGGLDIAHTGLVYRDSDGVAHFMDASSKKSKMKVTIEPGPIRDSLSWSKDLTGAMFARPLEPTAKIRAKPQT